MLNSIKQYIPLTIKRQFLAASKSFSKHVKSFYLGYSFTCLVCHTRTGYFDRFPDIYFEKMDEFQCIHSIFTFETFNILNYECPTCMASDRDRLYALYISGKSSNKRIKFIDFAPSSGLSQFLKSLPFLIYQSADLNSELADDKVDLMDMHIYPSNSVDAFLCSHVLEHVEDDRRAMKELFRILKPGGWGIVMVPIQLNLCNVLEDSSHISEADRWKYYCQDDHVRLYSKQGFIDRLTEAGFKVNQLDISHFGLEKFKVHGIHPRSVLYVVEKWTSPQTRDQPKIEKSGNEPLAKTAPV